MALRLKPKPLPVATPPIDLVNQPPHYTHGDIECIDAIKAALGPAGFVAFLRGQVIKYTWRLLHKGNALVDAKKAVFYQNRLVAELQDAYDASEAEEAGG